MMPARLDSRPEYRPEMPSVLTVFLIASVMDMWSFFVATAARVDRLTSGYVRAIETPPPTAPARAWIAESPIVCKG